MRKARQSISCIDPVPRDKVKRKAPARISQSLQASAPHIPRACLGKAQIWGNSAARTILRRGADLRIDRVHAIERLLARKPDRRCPAHGTRIARLQTEPEGQLHPRVAPVQIAAISAILQRVPSRDWSSIRLSVALQRPPILCFLGSKVQASVARCLRTPPYAARRKDLIFDITDRLRGKCYRSIVVICNYTL